MNERIFELAKQADIIQWDSLPSGARTPDHESVVKAKKFAELIVRECIASIENTINYTVVTDDEAVGCEYAITDLMNRFGVNK